MKGKKAETEIVQPATEPNEPEPQPESPFPREQIEKAFNNPLLKSFKGYLTPIMDYLESVENRLKAADQNFQIIQQSFDKLEPLVNLSQQIQARQASASSGETSEKSQSLLSPNSLGSIMQLLPALLGSGSSAIGDKLAEKVMEAGLKQMTAGTTLLEAMQRKILSDMGAKIATEAVGS